MTSSVNVSTVTTANTFDNWRIQTNLLKDDVNEIARGDFVKPTGNVTITLGRLVLSNANGTMLDVTADARISGKLSIKNIEQDGGLAYFYSDSPDIKFRAANGVFYSNGNTHTRFLYNNTFISAANINANGYIETTGTYANANLIMNIGGVFTVRTAANSSNVYVNGNLIVSNIATIGNARITLSNTTTANIITLRVDDPSSVANIRLANIATLQAGNVSISGGLNVTTINATSGNIATLEVASLVVTNPISAPAESDASSYRLRVLQSTRGSGSFGVFQGTSNGNALIQFTTSGNVWRMTSNDITGTFDTILSTTNIASTYDTSSSNVGSILLVKGANDNAQSAFAAANSAANTVRVSANTGSTINAANGINFNNTSTVIVTVQSGINGNANVSFTTTGSSQGATGAQGTSGSNGAQGAAGAQGATGTQGAVGTQGANGSNGTQGATGAQGTNGSNGTQGATGTQGVSGSNGSQGATGTQGTTGIQGIAGSNGTQGATGPSTAINASNYASGTYYPVMVAASGANYTPIISSSYYFSTGTVYSTDFASTSDMRLKNIHSHITDPFTIVNGINGVRYSWNDLAHDLGYINEKTEEVGVIAQQVQEMLPEAVYTDSNGYLRVSYGKLVPVLLEAVKELNLRVKALENR